MSTLICLKTCKYTMKDQWEGIHWSINQTLHFPQLKFKFDPLNIPSGVTILWIHIFHVRSYSTTILAFYSFMKILIFRKDLESPLIFVLFLKGKKIRKKNSKCDSWRKNKSVKVESGFKGQVTYRYTQK